MRKGVPMTTTNVIDISPNKAGNDNEQICKKDYSYWHYLKVCLWSKFFCFKGRARRKEYITFQLADFLIAFAFYAVISYGNVQSQSVEMARDIVSGILIIPLLSVSVRRFHDVGLSGWWCCLGVVPYVAMIFLAIKDSAREENKYGAIPEGKIFAQPLWARYMNRDKNNNSNVVEFNSNVVPIEEGKEKSTERVA